MIKKLSKYIKEYKKESILAPFFVVLEVLMDISIPYLISLLIDNGIEKGDMNYVIKIGITMLIAALLAIVFGILSGIYAAKASAGLARNLRRGIFYNVQEFAFSNIDKYSTAGLITRLTTDVTNVQNAFQMIIRMFTRAPIMMVSAVIASFFINKELAPIFIGSILFLGIILYFIIRKAHGYFKKLFRKYDDLNACVQENLTGIRVVKAYVREEYEEKKFGNAVDTVYDYSIKAEKLIILNSPAMQFTVYTSIMLLCWFGGRMIVSDRVTTGELMSLFTYATTILISLMILSMIFVMITMAKSSAERIVEVLDEKSDLSNHENPVYEVRDGSIDFHNVSFSYQGIKDNLHLEDINLNIKSGETIGIIGGTGSAKSTLVQLIPRLYDVTEGSIKVAGIDVKDYDIESLRNNVSMVLQKNVLFSGTIKENLRWGNKDATEEQIINACKAAQAHEFIDKFPNRYNTYIEQGGTNVSGGQKQRLCIARALLKKPRILILDDSTSAVDTKTDALINKAFKEEIPDTTKIIIAQRISSIQECDRIIVLDDGKITGFDTHEGLLETNVIYKEVYESQVKGGSGDENI